MEWAVLAKNRDKGRVFENVVMNTRVPQKRGVSRLDENLLASQERLCSMELVTCYNRLPFTKAGTV